MNITKLNKLSKEARKQIIRFHYEQKRSHVASSLSCIDIIVHLYFNQMKEGDTFILSKGHASSALYTVLKMKGYKVPEIYPAHPERNKEVGVFCSSGSLGHGLSIGCGVAKANPDKTVYVLISDGELNEGSTWEAIQFAQHNRLSNLTALVDYNGWQASGLCVDTIDLRPLTNKFKAFGWGVYELNGHSHEILRVGFDFLFKLMPKVLICHTVKGKGLACAENTNEYHYRCPDEKDLI